MASMFEVRRQKAQIWSAMNMLSVWSKRVHAPKQILKQVEIEFTYLVGLTEGLQIMAGKPKKNVVSGEWGGFATIQLSLEHKEMFGAWDLEDDDIWVLATSLIMSGYKLTLSYNDANQSYSASLTCRDKASVNAGLTLSGYASTWYQALRVVLFKHEVVANGDWGGVKSAPLGDIG